MEMNNQDIEALRRLEEGLWCSKVRFDLEKMNAILAPDVFGFGRSVRVYDRSGTLGVPPQGVKAILPLAEFKVRWIDADVAQVTYISDVTYEHGKERALRSSIWSRTGDGWQLRFHQGTAMPGPKDPKR